MNIHVFSVSKYPDINEDHWHIPESFDRPIVVCDGASESFNSNLWARILAKGLESHEDFTATWLEGQIGEYEKACDPASLSWSKQAAYERGSFSTFLSVQLTGEKCLVNAAGDTEVFIVADNWLIDFYPYRWPDEFQSQPVLLSTKKEDKDFLTASIDDSPHSAILSLAGASHIIMATDALAHWLMKRRDAGDKEALRFLLNVDDAGFREFVERERRNDLRLDDTTMIRIDLHNIPPRVYDSSLTARKGG